MKTVVIVLLILGIGNLLLAIRRNKHDEDHIFEKSQARSQRSTAKTIKEMQSLSAEVDRQESQGIKDSREQQRMTQLSERLNVQASPLASVEKRGGGAVNLKRF